LRASYAALRSVNPREMLGAQNAPQLSNIPDRS